MQPSRRKVRAIDTVLADHRMLPAGEAAQLLGLSVAGLSLLAADPATQFPQPVRYREGGHLFYPAAEVLKWLEARRRGRAA